MDLGEMSLEDEREGESFGDILGGLERSALVAILIPRVWQTVFESRSILPCTYITLQVSCTESVTAHLVQPDVDCVHADVLRVNLQQENQLLQLPGGTGRELKQQTICIN